MKDSLKNVKTSESLSLQEEIALWLDARTALAIQRPAEALGAYNQAIQKYNGNNPATYYERALVELQSGDYEQALLDLDATMGLAQNLRSAATEIPPVQPAKTQISQPDSSIIETPHVVTQTVESSITLVSPIIPTKIIKTPSAATQSAMVIAPTTQADYVVREGYKSSFYSSDNIRKAINDTLQKYNGNKDFMSAVGNKYSVLTNLNKAGLLNSMSLISVFATQTSLAQTATSQALSTPTVAPLNSAETPLSTAAPTETPFTPTETSTPLPTLTSPLEYSPILAFDNQLLPPETRLCWTNEIVPLSDLVQPEGFNRKIDETWWVFNTWDGRTNEESVRADFGGCQNGMSVNAIALNVWVTQLKPGSGDRPEGEFGLYQKAENGSTREYTLWVDENYELHLRIRENAQVVYDERRMVVNVQANGDIYNQFRIQIFLEMDNNGSAIIYLSEATSDPAKVQDINPNQMIRIDAAVRPKMGALHGFGLIGRGGSTQVLIWPLGLLGK